MFLHILPTTIFILSVLLILVDVYGSGNRLQHHLGFDSRIVALLSAMLFLSLRLFKPNQAKIHKGLSWINTYILLPITLASSVILSVCGFLAPPNFVYSFTHLQYQQIFLLAVFSGYIVLLQQPNQWFKTYASLLIFFSSVAIFAIAEVVWMFPFETFRILSHEDGLIEYVQVATLLLGSFWSMRTAHKFFSKNQIISSVAFGVASLMLLFVAGDEISWGQRIFDLQTPQAIYEQNAQGEITVHNLQSIGGYIELGYFIIGALGAFTWILQSPFNFLKKGLYAYLIPPWYTSFYFFLGFVYLVWANYFPNKLIGHWSEFAELMLYTGIMFTIYYWPTKSEAYVSKS